MGYGDGLAAVIGKTIKSRTYKIKGNKKTLAGSTTMFVVTLIILFMFLKYIEAEYVLIKSIMIAVLMTIIEAVSIKGTDNITVPLVTSLLTFFMI